jgi:metallophosphoesterase (TIGR00282 family)
MKILMVGDVVGSGGRRAVRKLLPSLRQELGIDFVTLQGENLAGGFGLTLETVQEMLEAGADVITTGNHVWDKRQFVEHLDDDRVPVLRPLNYPAGVPGRGFMEAANVGIVNLIGRIWVGEFDSPFSTVDELLVSGWGRGKPVVVDFHAEATSEKMALGWHLDGRVTALVGTHTHVATADCRVLPDGTAYVTDLGMVGATDSVIGMGKDEALERFLTGVNKRFRPVESGPMRFNSVLIETDDDTNLATNIERVDRTIDL